MAARAKKDPGTTKPKYRYQVTNWAEYDRALVSRGDLTIWFDAATIKQGWTPPPPVGRGKPGLYSALAIQTCLTLKALFRLPYRATEGLMKSLMRLNGLDLPVPDHTHMSRRAAQLAVKIPWRPRKGPVHVVVDSTGLKIFGEGEWKVRQHGVGKRRTWRTGIWAHRRGQQPTPQANPQGLRSRCPAARTRARSTATRGGCRITPTHFARTHCRALCVVRCALCVNMERMLELHRIDAQADRFDHPHFTLTDDAQRGKAVLVGMSGADAGKRFQPSPHTTEAWPGLQMLQCCITVRTTALLSCPLMLLPVPPLPTSQQSPLAT